MQLFSTVFVAYINPSILSDFHGSQYHFWLLSHVTADQKFMTLFAVLFGAGIILLTNKLEEKNSPVVTLYLRRSFWLLVIGLVHSYCFFSEDVLVGYSLCATWVFFLRRQTPLTLLITGTLLVGVASLIVFVLGLYIEQLPVHFVSDLQIKWQPSNESLNAEVAAYQGGWLQQMPTRASQALNSQTLYFVTWSFWRVSGLMLIGMALYKWHYFGGEKRKAYRYMALIGPLVGFSLVGLGVLQNNVAQWAFDYSQFYGWQYNYWGSLFVSAGYLAIIMLLLQNENLTRKFSYITDGLTAIGRTPLSNYLLQTLVGTSIFYGHGLGLFGQISRGEQWLFIIPIWLAQLHISIVWVRHFRYGPAEWLWKSLMYKRRLPFKIPSIIAKNKEAYATN